MFQEDRQKAIQWARTIANNPQTVFLDTETTGVGETDEIIEVGMVDLHGNVLIDTLLRPMKTIHPEASRVNGILNEHVLCAPSWTETYPKVAEVLEGKIVVVYNKQFDYKMFVNMGRLYKTNTTPPGDSWECAMLQYSAYRGVIDMRKNDYRWHKLTEAIREFENNPGGAHRAKDDAETCRRVVLGMSMTMF